MFAVYICCKFAKPAEQTQHFRGVTNRTHRMSKTCSEFESEWTNRKWSTRRKHFFLANQLVTRLDRTQTLSNQTIAVFATSGAKQRVMGALEVPCFVLVEQLETLDSTFLCVVYVVLIEVTCFKGIAVGKTLFCFVLFKFD